MQQHTSSAQLEAGSHQGRALPSLLVTASQPFARLPASVCSLLGLRLARDSSSRRLLLLLLNSQGRVPRTASLESFEALCLVLCTAKEAHQQRWPWHARLEPGATSCAMLRTSTTHQHLEGPCSSLGLSGCCSTVMCNCQPHNPTCRGGLQLLNLRDPPRSRRLLRHDDLQPCHRPSEIIPKCQAGQLLQPCKQVVQRALPEAPACSPAGSRPALQLCMAVI